MPVKDKNKKPEGIISQTKFAQILGLKSHTAIVHAIDTGRIVKGVWVNPKNGHRKIILDVALKEWKATEDESKAYLRENAKGKKKRNDNPDGKKSDSTTLVGVKLQKARLDLQLQAIKLRKEKNELVEKEVVYKVLFEYGKSFRDTILVIPDRIVDEILAAKSRNEIHNLLTISLEDALRELSQIKTISFDDSEGK